MAPQFSQVERAATLDGESSHLQRVLTDLADHSRKRAYADWLTAQNDPRGAFLTAVLDDWEAGQPSLAADESVSPAWRDTCGITLLQKLREGQLDAQAAAICAIARPALLITPAPAKEALPIGAGKFGGKPDLPAGTDWPDYKGKLLGFLGQIRLEELQGTQAASQLPDHGLLSFFVFDDPEETGQPGAGDPNGGWKIFFTADTSGLRRCDPPKRLTDGNELRPECTLQLRETLDLPYVDLYSQDPEWEARSTGCRRGKALGLSQDHCDAYEELLEALHPDREQHSHLLGWSHPQVAADDPVDEAMRHLITFASEECLSWCWGDGHQLFFSLSPDDFAAGRFDRIDVTDG